MTKDEIKEFNRVLEAVAASYKVSANQVLGQGRMRPLPEARHMIYMLLREKVHPDKLGQMTNRQRTTVLHGRATMRDRIFIYPDTKKIYERLIKQLNYDDQTK